MSYIPEREVGRIFRDIYDTFKSEFNLEKCVTILNEARNRLGLGYPTALEYIFMNGELHINFIRLVCRILFKHKVMIFSIYKNNLKEPPEEEIFTRLYERNAELYIGRLPLTNQTVHDLHNNVFERLKVHNEYMKYPHHFEQLVDQVSESMLKMIRALAMKWVDDTSDWMLAKPPYYTGVLRRNDKLYQFRDAVIKVINIEISETMRIFKDSEEKIRKMRSIENEGNWFIPIEHVSELSSGTTSTAPSVASASISETID